MPVPASKPFAFFTAMVLACLAASSASASQQFTTAARNGGQDFAYRYTTHAGDSQTLQFRLNLDDIQRGRTEFARIDETALQTYRLSAMQKHAAALATNKLTIALARQGDNGISINLSGLGYTKAQLADIHNQLAAVDARAQQNYLTLQMRKVVKSTGSTNLMQPDYPAIATRYTAAMQPVAQAIRQQVPGADQNPRSFINAALNFLQTIPYDKLDNRATSNGEGFQTPYGLIEGNLGDCDTKTVALASLIRAAYPSVPLAVIMLPDHAFLGVGLPQQETDYALATTNGTYLLADPTGPRQSPLGQVDEETRAHLKHRATQTEVLPIP